MSENQMSVMDINAPITYDSAFGSVTLSRDVVLKYLKRGSSDLTDQEIALFINLCRYQRLNPFIGEAYAIKFGNDFQMIVGYDTYKRRAEENPEYRGREDGIVVLRGNDVSKREGACLYPGDTLLGGWCRVHRERNGHTESSYTEVSLSEYQKTKDGKPTSNWGSKPATMIRKVAVSQALRDAFPTQYEGLHTEYEMPSGQDSNDAGDHDTAIELVEGGTFLVYYEDVDNFGRETKLLDMRFNQQRRWQIYVERVAHAIYNICRRIDLSFDDAVKVADRSIPNSQQRTDEDDRLWLVVMPASTFIVEHLKGANFQTCTTDRFGTDPETLWYVIERGEQDEV